LLRRLHAPRQESRWRLQKDAAGKATRLDRRLKRRQKTLPAGAVAQPRRRRRSQPPATTRQSANQYEPWHGDARWGGRHVFPQHRSALITRRGSSSAGGDSEARRPSNSDLLSSLKPLQEDPHPQAARPLLLRRQRRATAHRARLVRTAITTTASPRRRTARILQARSGTREGGKVFKHTMLIRVLPPLRHGCHPHKHAFSRPREGEGCRVGGGGATGKPTPLRAGCGAVADSVPRAPTRIGRAASASPQAPSPASAAAPPPPPRPAAYAPAPPAVVASTRHAPRHHGWQCRHSRMHRTFAPTSGKRD
jgi:hypothetical protein